MNEMIGMPETFAEDFWRNGYAVVPDVLDPTVVTWLKEEISRLPDGQEVRRKQRVYGVRNILEICPAVRELAGSRAIHRIIPPLFGEAAYATRAVFFDKVPGANWTLGWHQDSVISLAEKKPTPGFLAWGDKAGVWQVQPPAEILAKMVAVRVHLDDCGPENGPLRVLPGSHLHGWLDDDISTWKQKVPEVVCTAKAGDVVLMCPLILHASSKAESPSNRRVIHLEYANQTLPGGLKWNTQIFSDCC